MVPPHRSFLLGLVLALSLTAPQARAEPGDARGRTVPAAVLPAARLDATRQTYASALLGTDRRYEVALPPGYVQHPERRYPVIVLLHGGSGDQSDWFSPQKGDALATLARLYQQGELPPSIVVAPDGNDKRGRSRFWDPQYFDGPQGPMAAALGNELVKVIQNRYRTLQAPHYWALGGLSSGAWGAVTIGLKWPAHFSILFSHSGYFLDRSGPANSPMLMVPSLPRPQLLELRVYLDAGQSDGRYREESARFHALLQRLGVKSTYHEYPGSHSWTFWRDHLADSLRFVGAQWSEQA